MVDLSYEFVKINDEQDPDIFLLISTIVSTKHFANHREIVNSSIMKLRSKKNMLEAKFQFR